MGHTNKNTQTNRVTLVLKNPEVFEEFTKTIQTQYNNIRGHRIEIIEDLLKSYNKNQKVITEDPEVYKKENQELQQKLQQLIINHEAEVTQINVEHTQEINNLNKIIKNLEDKLKEKTTSEEVQKNHLNNIDNQTKKQEEIIDQLKRELQQKEEKIDEINTKYETALKENTETILELTTKHQQEIKEKDNEIKLKDNEYKQAVGYTVKLHQDINQLRGLSLYQRIFKYNKYPEDNTEVKEITTTQE